MPRTRAVGQAARIYIGEGDRLHRRPLYEVIVRMAREMGLPGATVFRGVEGYGAGSVLHTARVLRLSEDLPIVIEIIDVAERLAPFLDRVEELIDEASSGALMTLETIQILRYSPDQRKNRT